MEAPGIFAHFIEALRQAGVASARDLPSAAGMLNSCRGLVVCSGAGKSGLVARKLAASLNTLGRRALWLDPGAAAHGEAGLLGPQDLLVLISRSGESDEVVDLALHAPCPVLVLTARSNSRLGRAARLVLDCGQVADPGDAPPTASFLAAAAVADALVLLAGSGAEASEAHPAGAIGRAREITVGRLMHPPPSADPALPMVDLLSVITRHGLGAVVLVQDGALVGIVTDGDLRRAVERHGPRALDLTGRDIATTGPVTVRDSDPIGRALSLMEDRPSQIAVLPVLDAGGRVVGLVRIHDLVQAGLG